MVNRSILGLMATALWQKEALARYQTFATAVLRQEGKQAHKAHRRLAHEVIP